MLQIAWVAHSTELHTLHARILSCSLLSSFGIRHLAFGIRHSAFGICPGPSCLLDPRSTPLVACGPHESGLHAKSVDDRAVRDLARDHRPWAPLLSRLVVASLSLRRRRAGRY